MSDYFEAVWIQKVAPSRKFWIPSTTYLSLRQNIQRFVVWIRQDSKRNGFRAYLFSGELSEDNIKKKLKNKKREWGEDEI